MNIFSNPIVLKNLRSQMRQERLIGISVGYIGFLILICFLNFLVHYGEAEYAFSIDLAAVCKSIHLCLLILQFCLYFIFGFNTSSSAIVKERDQRTYEFFKTLPMSYKDIIIGEMIGPTLTIHYLQLITIPLTVITGLVAGVSMLVMAKLYIVLVFGGFFLNALGLLASSMAKKQSSVNLVIICTIGLLVGAPCIGMGIYKGYEANFVSLLSPVTLFVQYFSPYYRVDGFNTHISFFALKMPILIYTCLIYTCLGITFLAGTFRKLRDETAPPFSRKKAPFLFLIFELILIGFMRDVFRIEDLPAMESFSVFFQISWFVLIGLSLMLTPDYASVFAWLRSKKRGGKQLVFDLFSHSGSPILIVSIIGYLIMMIVGLSVYAYLPTPFIFAGSITAKFALGLGMLLGYLLAYLLIAQLGALLSKEKGPVMSTAFVTILYILPFLLAGFSQLETFLLFNPTSGSYFSGAFVSDKAFHENWWHGLVIPYTLTILFAVLAWIRMRRLRKV